MTKSIKKFILDSKAQFIKNYLLEHHFTTEELLHELCNSMTTTEALKHFKYITDNFQLEIPEAISMKKLEYAELTRMYDAQIDELHGTVEIANLPCPTSFALKCIDESVYLGGFNDWLNDEIRQGLIKEKDGEYYIVDEY